MKSKTFQAGKYRVTVRQIYLNRPTGLAGIGWNETGVDLTIKINKTNYVLHGSITGIKNTDKFYVSLASIDPWIKHLNTFQTNHFKNKEDAFNFVCNYVKQGLENEK